MSSTPEGGFTDVDRSAFADLMMEYLEQVATLPEVRRWHEVAFDLLDLAPGLRVLEAGAGLGHAARELSALVQPGGSVTAVDLSGHMVEQARARDDGDSGVAYEVADITDLPYAGGWFDRVRCERVLQHVAEPDLALAEFVRVTASEGIVCVIDSDWRSVAVDVDDRPLTDAVLGHLATTVPQPELGRTLRRRLTRAGLSDVQVRVCPATYTSLADVATIYPPFDERIPAQAGLVPVDLRDAWFSALRRADAEGTLWVAALFYVAAGTVPPSAA